MSAGGFPEDIRSAEINGTSLAYVDRGQGQNVVFVHGTSQDMRTWLHQLEPVSAKFRAIAYSRRYARPNEDIPPGQDDPMRPHVDDLLAFLRSLNATPAHLVGSSWGGFISLVTAIREPQIVRSLTLCEPPVLPLFVSNDPKPGEILRLALRSPIDAFRIVRFGVGVAEPVAKAYRAGDIEKANRIFGTALLGKQGFESIPDERRQMLDENQAVEIAQFLGEGFPPLEAEDVRAMEAPALLVAGERTPPLFRKTIIGKLEQLLPDAERVEIPNAAHLMHEENPEAFNTQLLSFLNQH